MYYVNSNGDEPFQIYFSEEEALDQGDLYIDVFDKSGMPIKAFHQQADGSYQEVKRT